MKALIRFISFAAMTVLAASATTQGNQAMTMTSSTAGLMSGNAVQVNQADSAEISKLLVQARTHAKAAADTAASLDGMRWEASAIWQVYSQRLSEMQESVNALGKVNTQLRFLNGEGSPWQQIAITRIDLHARALAGQLTDTIYRLNAYPTRVHMPPFIRQVKATCKEAHETAGLIGDFVAYGNARANLSFNSNELERWENKLDLPRSYGGM